MAMSARIKWYGDEVLRTVNAEIVKRMHVAVNHLKQATRRNLNKHKTRTEGPSKLGEIPHVDTGILRDSVFERVNPGRNDVTGDVGMTLDYGIHHEIKGRPFLRPTLKMEERAIANILTGGRGGRLTIDVSSET